VVKREMRVQPDVGSANSKSAQEEGKNCWRDGELGVAPRSSEEEGKHHYSIRVVGRIEKLEKIERA